ncbi:hypothetical protein SAMN05216202_1107 [Pseudomonas mucidolens]|uniref:Uncharacterized protein n=1 Tax=Pseudomonas mucidolens TaxID=46679 RepID=A0A1H2M643_9PSED|nr:hypothetical protein SAMN05216202_1107 [Pseudomonas mucidolens]SQH34456.1 Uncharacterised protein [Pseudomonas mucidolens]
MSCAKAVIIRLSGLNAMSQTVLVGGTDKNGSPKAAARFSPINQARRLSISLASFF